MTAHLPFGDPPAASPASPRAPASPGARTPAVRAPAAPARSRRRAYTVSELTATIRLSIESALGEVWVEGELSNCRLWKTGHLYFTLKDGGAQIRGVVFRSALRYLRFEPEDGLQVIARGRVGVYPPKGEYQLVAEHLEPRGTGARQLAFEQLRRRLADEGLFDASRKRPLPALPRRIGIVTSLDGAALRDIVKVLGRRHPTAHLVVSPARVQGEGAARSIVGALRRVQRVERVDVVIVGRGGGSTEDLWAFNEEPVVRAVAASKVPVISAVGHETDSTIADFAADVRAATPSAAAEIVLARKDELTARIDRATAGLGSAVRRDVERRRSTLHAVESRPGLAAWPARLAMRGRQADELTHRLLESVRADLARRTRRSEALRLRLDALDVGRRLARIGTRVVMARERLARAMEDRRRQRRARVEAASVRAARAAAARNADGRRRLEITAAGLEPLNPLGVLARGYAVCWNAGRTAAVRRADDVAVGDAVRVTLHDGALRCEVTAREPRASREPEP